MYHHPPKRPSPRPSPLPGGGMCFGEGGCGQELRPGNLTTIKNLTTKTLRKNKKTLCRPQLNFEKSTSVVVSSSIEFRKINFCRCAVVVQFFPSWFNSSSMTRQTRRGLLRDATRSSPLARQEIFETLSTLSYAEFLRSEI